MKPFSFLVLPILLVGAERAAAQCGTTTTESFTNGSNHGFWNCGTSTEVILASGGSPGAYLRIDQLVTITPQPQTRFGAGSVFEGDYQVSGVTSLGIDLQTFAVDHPMTCQRPLSLLLDNDMGVYVYFTSNEQVPCVDGRWHSYTIPVPSQSTTIPPGWQKDPFTALTPDQAWNLVIHDVDRVRWFYGDPTTISYPLAMWTIGVDNPRISYGNAQTTYCTAKVNSLGCSPAIGYSGLPSATLPTPFVIQASQVRNNVAGLLIYGVSGKAGGPFQSGTLCIMTPIRRTPVVNSGGNPAPVDCSGMFSIDMNAFASGALGGSPLPALTMVGTVVDCQWWGRDPGFAAPNNTTLSNGLEYSVCP